MTVTASRQDIGWGGTLYRMSLISAIAPTSGKSQPESCPDCGHEHQERPMFRALRVRMGQEPKTACSERYELDDMVISDEDCGCKNPYHTLT